MQNLEGKNFNCTLLTHSKEVPSRIPNTFASISLSTLSLVHVCIVPIIAFPTMVFDTVARDSISPCTAHVPAENYIVFYENN